MNDGTPRVVKRRWIPLLAVVVAVALGVVAAAAIAQSDTSKSGVSATAEVTTSQEITGEVVPAGGTAAGDGGTAPDGRSVLPILLGITGLGLAGAAAGLARRRRFD